LECGGSTPLLSSSYRSVTFPFVALHGGLSFHRYGKAAVLLVVMARPPPAAALQAPSHVFILWGKPVHANHNLDEAEHRWPGAKSLRAEKSCHPPNPNRR
jgi:hypothetical protein